MSIRFLCVLFLLAVSFITCDRANLPDPIDYITNRNSTLDISYTAPPINNLEGQNIPYRFAKDIPYRKAHERNTLDIFTLKNQIPSPLVIFIHSGGFVNGNKEQAYTFSEEIKEFLSEGIAFASINYRFLKDSDEGVITSLEDVRDALQFFRLHAKEFNIDPDRISCFGVSAGAGAALWLATHDEMANVRSNDPLARQSSRIRSAVALATQASYDLVTWEEIFKKYGFRLDDPSNDPQALFDFYGIQSIEELYRSEMIIYRKKVNMLGLFSADDAPVYVFNNGTDAPPTNTDKLYHHPFHALSVKEAADKVGVENQVYAPGMNVIDARGETPLEFTIRHLKK